MAKECGRHICFLKTSAWTFTNITWQYLMAWPQCHEGSWEVGISFGSGRSGVNRQEDLPEKPALRHPCTLSSWGRVTISSFRQEVGKIHWRRERLPTVVFWPGEFHGLHSPWSRKELDMTEWLSLSDTIYSHCYFCFIVFGSQKTVLF